MFEVLFGMTGGPQTVAMDRCRMVRQRYPVGKQLWRAAVQCANSCNTVRECDAREGGLILTPHSCFS